MKAVADPIERCCARPPFPVLLFILSKQDWSIRCFGLEYLSTCIAVPRALDCAVSPMFRHASQEVAEEPSLRGQDGNGIHLRLISPFSLASCAFLLTESFIRIIITIFAKECLKIEVGSKNISKKTRRVII